MSEDLVELENVSRTKLITPSFGNSSVDFSTCFFVSFIFCFLRSIRCPENIEFAHGELFNMPERLPRREHFWQLALAYRRYREWSIPRELVCPNFLDLREFIIIFALRNNRASLASFVLSSVTSSHSLLLFTHARDENYSTVLVYVE